MCFNKIFKKFRKNNKSEKEKVIEDINYVKSNMQKVSVLLVCAEEVEDISIRLRKIQEILKYSNPVSDTGIQELDKKIGKKLEEVQEFLNDCHNRQNYEGWQDKVRELEILIAERNAQVI